MTTAVKPMIEENAFAIMSALSTTHASQLDCAAAFKMAAKNFIASPGYRTGIAVDKYKSELAFIDAMREILVGVDAYDFLTVEKTELLIETAKRVNSVGLRVMWLETL